MISPSWIRELARAWNAGTHGVYLLHGNIFDLFPVASDATTEPAFENLKTLLAQRVFPNRKMLLFFDIVDGLTFANSSMQAAFIKWLEIYSEAMGRPCNLPVNLVDTLKIVRAYNAQDTGEVNGKMGITLVVVFAEKIVPSPSNQLNDAERMAEVALLKFAASHLKQDAGVFLLTETPANLSESLTNNPYVAQIRVEMPDESERAQFLASGALAKVIGSDLEKWCGMKAGDIATRTAGLNLRRLQNLIAWAVETRTPFDSGYIAQGKKRLIEEFCLGLVTFKEADPAKTLENVANHAAAKLKLRQVAQLVKSGRTHVLEKGILLPGRIGVGKSYLVDCFASDCGMPMLELGNFRSQWVGETEKQLSKILMTVKALGPVVVVIDEADAVLGNSRDGNSNDSGIGNRIFAALAAHIGDDKIRGKEIWIAMTSRPDLLAIDMKRQGRFGLCIPLFPAQSEEETKELFEVVAKTRKLSLGAEELKAACQAFGGHPITGSDAEAILIRAQEAAELKGKETPTSEEISEAISSFIDPLDPDLLRMQELAAVLACTDRRYLPKNYAGADRSVLRIEMEATISKRV